MKANYRYEKSTRRHSDASDAGDSRPGREAPTCRFEATSLLSAEAEHDLAMRIKAGDAAARDALILANMRLVLNIAGLFHVRGMEMDDLIQEGNLGLMRAAEDFDPETHGTRFSTYASYWIRHHIMRAASGDGSMIHFPYYLVTLRKRFNRVKAELVSIRRSTSAADQGEPTIEDVAVRMGIEARRLRYLHHAQVDVSSYSASTLDAEEAGFSEELLSEDLPPEKPLETAEEMEQLYAAMAKLPRFEAWLIQRRFRLDDQDDDAPDRRKRSPSRASGVRSRAASGREEMLEARRIKRANEQADEPRSYRELERECGLAVYRLKQIEGQALEKLKMALARATHASLHLPLSSAGPTSRAQRRASA